MAKKSLVKATEVLSQNTLVQFLPLKLNPKTNKILLNLTVKPGAKSSKLCAVDAEAASIQVSAPPTDGEANDEVVRFMASVFKQHRRNFCLVSGLKSRQKVLEIDVAEKISPSIDMASILKTFYTVLIENIES